MLLHRGGKMVGKNFRGYKILVAGCLADRISANFPFPNCENFLFPNCQNFLFQTVKNFPFQTVKIFLFQTVKIFLSKL
jgi:hypothetical protein